MSSRRFTAFVIAALVALVVGVVLWRWAAVEKPPSHEASGARSVERIQANVADRRAQLGVARRRVAGTVVDEAGAPVPAATVRLDGAQPGVATDSTGHFDFGAAAAFDHVVTAERPQLTGAIARIDLRDPAAVPEQLKLVLYPCAAAIHGTVRDSAGGVIRGAAVARARGLGATTDDAGAYDLCVPVADAYVEITADGYASLADEVSVYGRTRRDYALSPGASIAGRVVRAGDRTPVPDAIVTIRGTGELRDSASTTCDAAGRFHVDALAPGRHVITAHADRVASRHPVEAVAEVGAALAEVVCEVAASFSVSGKVVERGTATPVAGVAVNLQNDGRIESQAISQADGSFVIDHVAPGTHQVGGGYGDAKRVAVTIVNTDIGGLIIEVERGATIAGRVLYRGKPVDGARVRANGVNADADVDGRFTIRGLEAGIYRISAESQRLGAFTHGPSVTIATGERRTGVEVELDMAGSIEGTVVDQNDAPVAGAFLQFSLLHGRDFGAATTADDGSFVVRALSGGGDYAYQVRPRAESSITFPASDGKRFAPIAVGDGATHITGLRVQVRVERLAITGRITDGSGRPVADVTISALRAGNTRTAPATTSSDQTGAFALRDIAPGTYELDASGAHGEARVENIAAGRSGIAIQLIDHGGIDGTVEGLAEPIAVTAIRTDVRSFRGTDYEYRAVVTGSSFRLRDLPAATYVVHATAGADDAGARVNVTPGTVTRVTLAKRATATVVGTVADESGRPVAGLRCAAKLRDGTALYDPRKAATSDANGAFRIERAAAGASVIACSGDAANGWGDVVAAAGAITRVALTVTLRKPEPRGRLGLTFEDQFGEAMVETVEPGGPAARAGVLVGDIVHKVGDRSADRWFLQDMELRIGEKVRLTIERNNRELIVTVTADAAP